MQRFFQPLFAKPLKSQCISMIRFFGTRQMNAEVSQDIAMTSGRIEDLDPEISDIIKAEELRQRESILLSPTSNYASRSVLDTLQTVLQNKYSEGYPGARYYGGNENVDNAERLAQRRALELFNLDCNEWSVNVQPLSGNIAIFEVLTGLISPGGRIMTPSNNTASFDHSALSKYFNILKYDSMNLNELADNYQPHLILSGNGVDSSFNNNTKWDYKLIGNISKANNAFHISDISDVAGLISSNLYPSPFPYSDAVICSPFTTLRGPRGSGMIFYRNQYQHEIDGAVFPGHQGGPHNHAISAMATSLKMAKSNEFISYQNLVMENTKAIENTFYGWKNIEIINNGTHCIAIRGLQNTDILYDICNKVNIDIYYDSDSQRNEFRLSSNAMTSRGLHSTNFVKIIHLFEKIYHFALNIKNKEEIDNKKKDIDGIKQEVTDFAKQFPLIGIDHF